MSTIVTRTGKGSALTWAEADANFTNLNTDKAELASPTFTGTPAAPTAAVGTNTTQVATTAFVQGKTAAQTPFTATGNIVATNVQSAIAEVDTEKVAKAGDTMTGPLRTPSSQVGTSATTTENHFWDGSVANQLSLKRGTPEAPGDELIKLDNSDVTFPNAAKASYAVTVQPASGAFSNASATGRYYQLGKFVFFTVLVDLVNVGTGTGALLVTLPHTLGASVAGSGRSITGGVGMAVSGLTTSTVLVVANYDGTSPLTNGNQLVVSATYIAA